MRISIITFLIISLLVSCDGSKAELIRQRKLEAKILHLEGINKKLLEEKESLTNDRAKLASRESDASFYTSLITLSESPSPYREDEESTHYYRMCLSLSEIYKAMNLEVVRYGEEGGGKQVISRTRLDLLDALDIFGEESSGLEFQGWTSSSSFKFNHYDANYEAMISAPDSVTFERR